MAVPAYLRSSSSRVNADRFARLSNVDPRTTLTDPVVLLTHSRSSSMGFGVVVTSVRGWSPGRSARSDGMMPSYQASLDRFHLQTSSRTAPAALYPRPTSGLSAPRKKILVPV